MNMCLRDNKCVAFRFNKIGSIFMCALGDKAGPSVVEKIGGVKTTVGVRCNLKSPTEPFDGTWQENSAIGEYQIFEPAGET